MFSNATQFQVEFLEKERENLQSQSESQAQLQNSQVDALEAVLESVTKEKESTKEHYENLLFKEKQQVSSMADYLRRRKRDVAMMHKNYSTLFAAWTLLYITSYSRNESDEYLGIIYFVSSYRSLTIWNFCDF